MPEWNMNNARTHCTGNRRELESSVQARCIYCTQTFAPDKIVEWITDSSSESAVCPHCDVDAVIGSASGIPLQDDQLFADLRKHWFE